MKASTGRGGWVAILVLIAPSWAAGADATITIDVRGPARPISRYLTGACIEDVNHEIYGGLYSQMIFGESFQEPERPLPLRGFTAYGGRWVPRDGALEAEGGDGPKLIADTAPLATGEVGVDIRFPNAQGGNAGLIVKVGKPGTGADRFDGYEISLETAGRLVLGRHRQNWEPIRTVPCDVPVGRWIALSVRMRERGFEVFVDGRSVTTFDDAEHPLAPGRVGLRTWQRPARYRNFRVGSGETMRQLAFEREQPDGFGGGVSGMWGAVRRRNAEGDYALEPREPFAGKQSQRVTLRSGEGAIGIENQGLNRWGLNLVAGKPYEGVVWARAERPTRVTLTFESRDGARPYAQSAVEVKAGSAWERYEFSLTPTESDRAGRFALTLEQPGTVDFGHVFLQPGEWGRFKGLPDRKDVAEALIDEGVTVLRYGGSMINHPEYRWKKMIGPRDRRPPNAGTWYPYSTNGWGIFDFLNFCEAAGFLAIPAVNMGESPADMADFVEYANGSPDTPWGRKRVADGHPAPYRLKHVELGNEEAVNEDYWRKFQPIAEAMWARDPELILVVGDFAYGKVIDNPFHFQGGAAANSLAAHKKILELARTRGREVWFDIHVWTDHPPEPNGMKPERSFIEQLGKLAPGSKHKVAIFEYNSGNHAIKRALSNALATNEVERIGQVVPVACAANCLQPDRQNDNGWDQGLLFLNPSQVWLQPTGYVVQMLRRHYQPLLLESAVRDAPETLSVNAKRSEDGKVLVLQVVNTGTASCSARVVAEGFTPIGSAAAVEELAGALEAVNTADAPNRVTPRRSEWPHGWKDGAARYTFPPQSFTIVRFE